ncbi:hypothetical protein NQ315_007335 [Exocentrus adspersus]|uniref:CCHC-type domain-containing protein n=1 Tax=Exocentrus adspersus TaxID=1586481 RepID=A0AAV8V6A8_9CUCU|nr:hypothetical protein NQ315_007335 [Exocentrus adspersus]
MAASNKFDEFSGDQDWQIYAERLEQYFVANKIEDDKLQVATLLSVVGVETYKLLRNLCHPDLPKSKKYAELTALLRKQYLPQVNFWRERRRFYKAKQEVAEPVAEWYARLRSLAINCDFKTRLPEVLKDKFVAGLNAGPVLDKVCELEDNRTLDDILKLALQKEEEKKQNGGHVEQEVNAVQSRSRTKPRPKQPNRKQKGEGAGRRGDADEENRYDPRQRDEQKWTRRQRGRPQQWEAEPSSQDGGRQPRWRQYVNKQEERCKVCGKRGHVERGCKYRSYECNRCGRRGHLARVCSRKEVNYVADEESESEYSDDDGSVSMEERPVMYTSKADPGRRKGGTNQAGPPGTRKQEGMGTGLEKEFNQNEPGDHADRITTYRVVVKRRGSAGAGPGGRVTESGLVAVHYDKPSGSKTRNIIEGNKNLDLDREIAGKRSEQNARREATAQGGQSTSDINKRSQTPIRRPKKLDL